MQLQLARILYLQFRFVDADTTFIDSSFLLKNTKDINVASVKHAAKIQLVMLIKCIDCARHVKKEKLNCQSHGNGNIHSKSSYLPSQEQQKPVGSSQTSEAINIPIQDLVANG